MKINDFYKKNSGIFLFITNIILFIIFIIVQDPFHLLSKVLENAPKLLKLDYKEIKEIVIDYPDKKVKYTITNITQNQDKDKKFKNVEDFINQTEWQLQIHNNQNLEKYPIDKYNLKDLLETLMDIKKYYSLPDNSENRTIAGISENSPEIRIKTKNKEEIIKIGSVSVRNNSTYIIYDKENNIYQIDNNLKSKTGYEDIYYFRNHQFLDIDKNKIEKLIINYKNNRFTYAKTANDWQLIEPKPEKLQYSSMEGIVEEIINFKATKFYNEKNPMYKNWENMNIKMQIFMNSGTMESSNSIELQILAKKDYVKYLIFYNNQYYEVSAYRIEDLLEPEKLIEKK